MDLYKISQHFGWMRMYLHGMTEANWADMKLRCERQLTDLEDEIMGTETHRTEILRSSSED